MPELLNASKIANMIGVEEVIIRRTLERHDADLEPYLYESSDHKPEETEEGKEASIIPDEVTPLLNLEGLPLLITKLAFNIPTSDIIENLACQVLHLTLLEEEKAELTDRNQELQSKNDQLQHRIIELQREVSALQAKLTELVEEQSQRGFLNLFKRKKSK